MMHAYLLRLDESINVSILLILNIYHYLLLRIKQTFNMYNGI